MLRLEEVVLREVRMPLRAPFVASWGTLQARHFLLVEVRAEGLAGWGEVAVLGPPFYTDETPATAWHVLASYLLPIALGRPWADPAELATALGRVYRHQHAKAGLEGAVWDLWAQRQGISLSAALGGKQPRVPVGVSLGMEGDVSALVETARRYLAQGYRRLKIKIRPGWDQEPLRALRAELGDVPLMADANGAYRLDDAAHLRSLDELRLLMIEQPLPAGDLVGHARLQAQLATPICLDESIGSLDEARTALELGSGRVICVKPGRLGGLSVARQLHDLCQERGVPVWCGGMLESGIGRAHNLALASLPGFVLPGDLSGSDRYWERDLIEPEVTVGPDGRVAVPSGPGLGVQVRREEVARHTLRTERFRAT